MSKAFQDCSWNGSLEDAKAMKNIIAQELAEERMCGVIIPFKNGPSHMLIFDPSHEEDNESGEFQLCVVTRSQSKTKPSKPSEPAPAVPLGLETETPASSDITGP